MQHPAQREREIAAVAGGEVEIGKRGKVSSQALTRSLSPPRQPTSTSIQLITLMAGLRDLVMEVWPVQHAKARFSELLDACQREGPQVVSRRGIETAVLVPIEEWRRVQARSRPSLKALLLTAEPRIEALAAERCRARRRAVAQLGGKGVSA
jgi:prevent-host-death family protein